MSPLKTLVNHLRELQALADHTTGDVQKRIQARVDQCKEDIKAQKALTSDSKSSTL